MSYINYACSLWDESGNNHLKRLRSLYRRAIKHIVSKDIETDEKIRIANLLPFKQQLQYNKCTFLYKIINRKGPKGLKKLFKVPKKDSRTGNFRLPLPRIGLYKSSFAFSGASTWNQIPKNIKHINSFTLFKTRLKKYFMHKR